MYDDDDDDLGDRQSLLRSNAALTEVVIHRDSKKTRHVTPKKYNLRKGSMDDIRKNSIGTTLLKIVEFYICT